jgi:hypothetical protein
MGELGSLQSDWPAGPNATAAGRDATAAGTNTTARFAITWAEGATISIDLAAIQVLGTVTAKDPREVTGRSNNLNENS